MIGWGLGWLAVCLWGASLPVWVCGGKVLVVGLR